MVQACRGQTGLLGWSSRGRGWNLRFAVLHLHETDTIAGRVFEHAENHAARDLEPRIANGAAVGRHFLERRGDVVDADVDEYR